MKMLLFAFGMISYTVNKIIYRQITGWKYVNIADVGSLYKN